MIDGEFLERLARERAGWPVVMQYTNWRFASDWEDVLQESLLALWKSRANLHNSEAKKAFFHGVVKHVALGYRRTKRDWAEHVELQDYHAVLPPEFESESESREQEIRQAREKLDQLLLRVRLRHRITFWEWRKRGYRCDTHAQQIELSRMLQALKRASGLPAWQMRRGGSYCARGEDL